MEELRRQLQEAMDRLRGLLSRWRSSGASPDHDAATSEGPHEETHAGSRRSGSRRSRAPEPAFGDDSDVVVATGEDDVASVVGRIDIADAPEVVLIVRRDARALRRPTAWPHIAAHVRRRGIELAVVSARGDVRAHARANGLRAARTPTGLRRRTVYVRSLDRTFTLPRMAWDRLIRGGMILLALGTIGTVGCYRVPSAVVTIVPDSEAITASGAARPNALVDRNDLATETILVSTIRRQLFTVVSTTTTGETEIGDEFAVLEVTFENAGSSVAQVPRLTRLLSEEGISFLTDVDLDVPAGDTATVGATAEFPGEPGNVPANDIVRIDSPVSPNITLASSTAGSGGTNQLVPAVAQEDVDRVREIAAEVLNRVAVGTLLQIVDEEERGTLLPTSVNAAIFSEQPVQQLEEPSEIFIVEYTISASGLVVSEAQARAYGELLVLEELPEGYAFLPGSVVAQVTPLGEGGRAQVDVTARVAELAEIAETASQIAGMRPSAAASFLQSELGLAQPPSIDIRPNFIPWAWLPRRASNIELVIAGPPEAAGSEAD